MSVIFEALSDLERKLTVTVPAAVLKGKIQKRTAELLPKTQVDGFRVGKLPLAIFEKTHGKQVRLEIIEQLIKDTLFTELKDRDLQPVMEPKVTIVQDVAEEDLIWHALFEVYPEIQLPEFKELTVEKLTVEILPTDVEHLLTTLQKQAVQWVSDEDPTVKSAVGDKLILNFHCCLAESADTASMLPVETTSEEIAKKPLPPIEIKDMQVILGDGELWAEFEQPLYDLTIGSTKQYTLLFPATHINREFAGKLSNITVTLLSLHHPKLPVLDDEFAINLGEKYAAGLASLKEEIQQKLLEKLPEFSSNALRQSIIAKLLAVTTFPVPKSLQELEFQRLRAQLCKKLNCQTDVELERYVGGFSESYMQEAKNNIMLRLLIEKIIEQYKLEVTEAEAREELPSAAMMDSFISKIAPKLSNKKQWMENMYKAVYQRFLEKKLETFLNNAVTIEERMVPLTTLLERLHFSDKKLLESLKLKISKE